MGEYYAIERSGTSLTHHGILGMKWGVRRYQNKDGSLTSAGKDRYSTGDSHGKPGLRRPGETDHEYVKRVYDVKGNGKKLVQYYKNWKDSINTFEKYSNKFLVEHPYGSDKFKKLMEKAKEDYSDSDHKLLQKLFKETAKENGPESGPFYELSHEYLWPVFSKNDPEAKRLTENMHGAYRIYSKKVDELAIASRDRVGSKPIRDVAEQYYKLPGMTFTEKTATEEIARLYARETEKLYYEEMKKKSNE